MEDGMEKEFELEESVTVKAPEKETEDIFTVKEVEIEEMAIDGVCGVY
jgi:mycofactocin precursor